MFVGIETVIVVSILCIPVCIYHSTDPSPPRNATITFNNNEWQTDEAAFHDEQHVEGLYYESTDVLGQGPFGREEGNRIRFEGGHYDDNVAALLKDGAAHRKKGNTQQDDQPKGTPNVVYAVVDKSKKRRKEKTQGGASATTTQDVCTEEQHYEMSSAIGQDWLGNVVEGKPEDNNVEQGSPSNDAKGTGPQSEPYNPNVEYIVVDKSKKRNRAKQNDQWSQSDCYRWWEGSNVKQLNIECVFVHVCTVYAHSHHTY